MIFPSLRRLVVDERLFLVKGHEVTTFLRKYKAAGSKLESVTIKRQGQFSLFTEGAIKEIKQLGIEVLES